MNVQVIRKTDHVRVGKMPAQVGMQTLDGEIVKVNPKSVWVKSNWGEQKLDNAWIYLAEARRFGWRKP